MRKSVMSAWFAFNAPFEGVCLHMYLDNLGLVSTGVGNLLEPMSAAEVLPFRKPNGMLATVLEIRTEWRRLKAKAVPESTVEAWRKNHQGAPLPIQLLGGAHLSQQAVTTLRLRKPDVETLVRRKLLQNEEALRDRFGLSGWNQWPACAQLPTHSMAWAMGSNGFAGFPKFMAHAKRQDFAAMAAECRVMPDRGTLKLRNAANRALFLNAARVVAEGLDPELLIFDAPKPPPDEVA